MSSHLYCIVDGTLTLDLIKLADVSTRIKNLPAADSNMQTITFHRKDSLPKSIAKSDRVIHFFHVRYITQSKLIMPRIIQLMKLRQ